MIRSLLVVALLGVAVVASGGQRSYHPIGAQDVGVKSLAPRERQQVENWLRELVAAWNTPRLGDYLDREFPRRQRLLGAIEDQVPPDARMRLLSVGPFRVIQEDRAPRAISRVIRVGVRLQIETPGDDGTVQRRESRQDLVVQWTRRLPE